LPIATGVDLHIHSSASDGKLAPEDIVDLAAQKSLRSIALCDHDTMAGIDRARRRGEQIGVEVLTGVEFGVNLDISKPADEYTGYRIAPGEIHLLGYGMRLTDQLRGLLAQVRTSRKQRITRMLELLNREGVEISRRDVRSSMGESKVYGRPHVADALVTLGYCKTRSEAFRKYLSPGNSAYVPRKKISLERVVEVIHASGGISVFAHPGCSGDIHPLFFEAMDRGVDGVEVVHQDHSFKIVNRLIRFARKNDRLCTGGSDFHGRTSDPSLGDITVPYQWLEDLKSQIC